MNVIEDGFTPMLQTLLSTTTSSKGKGSSGKSKGTSNNIRGRRNLKSSKGTSCGGKSKGDALDDPLCDEDMTIISPFDLSLVSDCTAGRRSDGTSFLSFVYLDSLLLDFVLSRPLASWGASHTRRSLLLQSGTGTSIAKFRGHVQYSV